MQTYPNELQQEVFQALLELPKVRKSGLLPAMKASQVTPEEGWQEMTALHLHGVVGVKQPQRNALHNLVWKEDIGNL